VLPLFPQFKKLTIDDKDFYTDMVKEYPPFSDIDFATLQIWWNLEDQLEISTINGNLVISYSLHFDEDNSGYSIIGKNEIDESIKGIFQELRAQNKQVKLVHVPDFVISEIMDRGDLELVEETDYNEYIIESKHLYSLEGSGHKMTRKRIKRFWDAMQDSEVEIRELDMADPAVKSELSKAITEWEKTKTTNNDPDNTEKDAINRTITHAEKLGIRHIGVYINGELKGIQLYRLSHDNNYYVLHHQKVDYSVPYIMDYLTHHVADKAVKENVEFINMEMDLGIEGLRRHKMELRPVNFFKKYTITPVKK
jgi:uncharacterized protein